MSEVEDVSWMPCGLRENAADSIANEILGSEEGDRIEIALHRARMINGCPCSVEGNTPIQAQYVGSGRAHCRQEAGSIDPEVDHRHPKRLNAMNQFRCKR